MRFNTLLSLSLNLAFNLTRVTLTRGSYYFLVCQHDFKHNCSRNSEALFTAPNVQDSTISLLWKSESSCILTYTATIQSKFMLKCILSIEMAYIIIVSVLYSLVTLQNAAKLTNIKSLPCIHSNVYPLFTSFFHFPG